MLATLKFVQGAVSTKDFVPEMKHFIIRDGHVRAHNGVIALSAPIDFTVNCVPKAATLVQAISKCDGVVTMAMSGNDKLMVRSEKFKAYVECISEEIIDIAPQGLSVPAPPILEAAQTLRPFIGNDATRPWSNGILLRGQSAFATNNVCLAEFWLGVETPKVFNIPMAAVTEILRIGEEPERMQVDENSVTFHYSGRRWLRTQLLSTEWPDLAAILNVECDPQPVPPDLFTGLEYLKPFCEDFKTVYFDADELSTTTVDGSGATYTVEGLPEDGGAYRVEMLLLLKGVAKRVDFSRYPKPAMFYGDRVRGAILGQQF